MTNTVVRAISASGAHETPAEVAMPANMGADLVGMSTVLETIAARHLGLEVLGISLAHSEVLSVASDANDTMASRLRLELPHGRCDRDDASGSSHDLKRNSQAWGADLRLWWATGSQRTITLWKPKQFVGRTASTIH